VEVRPDADVFEASLRVPSEFGEIFDRHGRTIHRFLARRVGAQSAEQLLGETFRIAFERRATFDARRGTVRPWLYGIATNVVRRHRRDEKHRFRALATLAGQATRDGSHEDATVAAADAASQLALVAQAVLDLADDERDVLLLFATEELSYDDIAAALDLPVGTVRSRLHRARAKVRSALDATERSAS